MDGICFWLYKNIFISVPFLDLRPYKLLGSSFISVIEKKRKRFTVVVSEVWVMDALFCFIILFFLGVLHIVLYMYYKYMRLITIRDILATIESFALFQRSFNHKFSSIQFKKVTQYLLKSKKCVTCILFHSLMWS